jgi:hypothetical protein
MIFSLPMEGHNFGGNPPRFAVWNLERLFTKPQALFSSMPPISPFSVSEKIG